MIIRKLAGPEILDALHLIWEVFDQDVAPDYTPEGVATFQNFIRYPNIVQKMQTDGLVMFGAFEGNLMTGAGGIFSSGHVALLFVRREFRLRGTGRALMGEMCSHAVRVYRVWQITVNAAPGAAEAYRHMGMKDTAPEQTAGGIRYIPMSMPVSAGAFRRKRGKGMWIAGGIGAACLVLAAVAGAALTKELQYAQENGQNSFSQGSPWSDGGNQDGESGNSLVPWGGYGQEDQGDSGQDGLNAIPEYIDQNCGYEVKQDSYIHVPEDQSSSLIQFEVYYPQVSGLKKEMEDKVNKALEDCALQSVDRLYLNPSQDMKEKVLEEQYPVLASSVDYKVTYQSPEFLSVVFQDSCYEGNENEHYVDLKCVNISLQDGTVYQVKDIVNLDDAFISAWADQMKKEADDDSLLSELTAEDMKAVLGGDTRNGVYEPEFFVDADGLEIGLSFRYPADSKDNRGFAWVTAPFSLEETAPYRTDSSFWSAVQNPDGGEQS